VISPFLFFTDPLLRGPMIGSILSSIPCALLGVFLFVRRKSLIGETLSHASYPGTALCLIGASGSALSLEFWVMGGGFLAAALGFITVGLLQKRRLSSDVAQTAVLATFFGWGVLFASFLQFIYPREYARVSSYLYGQIATLHDGHILLYGIFAFATTFFVIISYRFLQTASFQEDGLDSKGDIARLVEWGFLLFTVFAVVIGIRTAGVVLLSALFLAPAVSSRQCTHSLKTMLFLAPLFSALSCFLGNYLSYTLSYWIPLATHLPTGPLIVLFATLIALLALLFAPKRGLLMRYKRFSIFRERCLQENLLKGCLTLLEQGGNLFTFQEIVETQGLPRRYAKHLLCQMKKKGWVEFSCSGYLLTNLGEARARHIDKLHLLWEKYVETSLGMHHREAHFSAEKMEHILNAEMESQLREVLGG
jgi:manganese/zinc/iron transport system permease protein